MLYCKPSSYLSFKNKNNIVEHVFGLPHFCLNLTSDNVNMLDGYVQCARQ